MSNVISLVTSPEFIALLVGFLAALRGIGELFMLLGKVIPGEDWAEGVSAKISKIVTFIGRVFAWLGIGNNKK